MDIENLAGLIEDHDLVSRSETSSLSLFGQLGRQMRSLSKDIFPLPLPTPEDAPGSWSTHLLRTAYGEEMVEDWRVCTRQVEAANMYQRDQPRTAGPVNT